jgi:hypothetical protein
MGHRYLVAAYCCTWGIQLAYLSWMGLRWLGQKNKLRMAGKI